MPQDMIVTFRGRFATTAHTKISATVAIFLGLLTACDRSHSELSELSGLYDYSVEVGDSTVHGKFELHADGSAYRQPALAGGSVERGQFSIVGGFVELKFGEPPKLVDRFRREGSSLVDVETHKRCEKVGPVDASTSLSGDTYQKRTKVNHDLATLALLLDQRVDNHSTLPESLDELAEQFEKTDPWGHAYLYRRFPDGEPQKFEVRSLGPDGVPSDDDIVLTQ